jgi:DNA-binding NarL/FixJ family response regulator
MWMRVLLADAQPLLRDAIRVSMEAEPDLRVVATAGDGIEAVEAAKRERPDVVVVDVNLPNYDGVRAAREITASLPSVRVTVLAEREDPELLVRSIEAGATGFLTRNSPLPDLIDAVRRLGRGDVRIPESMLAGLIERLVARGRERVEVGERLSHLSHREREVVGLLAEGADTDDMARALVISPQTARSHIQRALRKLGMHSRLEAMVFVTSNGLLDELKGEPAS